MKVIRIIFLVYISCLTVFPCTDGYSCSDEKREGIAAIDVTDHHHHHENELDTCTPFCVCTACRSVTPQPISVTLIFPNTPFSQLEFFYAIPAVQPVAYAIWQPPKVS